MVARAGKHMDFYPAGGTHFILAQYSKLKDLSGVGAISSLIMAVCLILDKNILFYVNDLPDLISALIFFLSPMILNSVLLLVKSKYLKRRKESVD